jgi:hypothetical protein
VPTEEDCGIDGRGRCGGTCDLKEDTMPTTWRAALVSDQRGPVLTRRATTRADAFAQAHVLLEDAEERDCHHGEAISIRVEWASA